MRLPSARVINKEISRRLNISPLWLRIPVVLAAILTGIWPIVALYFVVALVISPRGVSAFFTCREGVLASLYKRKGGKTPGGQNTRGNAVSVVLGVLGCILLIIGILAAGFLTLEAAHLYSVIQKAGNRPGFFEEVEVKKAGVVMSIAAAVALYNFVLCGLCWGGVVLINLLNEIHRIAFTTDRPGDADR